MHDTARASRISFVLLYIASAGKRLVTSNSSQVTQSFTWLARILPIPPESISFPAPKLLIGTLNPVDAPAAVQRGSLR